MTQILSRNVENIIERASLEKKLASGKKLRIKFGIDPTAPGLHLGHSVVLRKLAEFQSLGHKAVLIIGDFTARIGDPSGRSQARVQLSPSRIKRNMAGYLKQAGKIIDVKKAEIHHNSEWLSLLKLEKLFELLGKFSLSQILEREDFKNRLAVHKPLYVHEILYPLMQAYDSAMVKADVEIGGHDQTLNLLMGRDLMQKFKMPGQDILTVPLLEGLDGAKKMSKSFGNCIALEDAPRDMFGKIMSLPDNLVKKYFLLCTALPEKEIENLGKIHPLEAKERLAFEIVKLYHGEKSAAAAKDFFEKTFRKRELPSSLSVAVFRKGELLQDILKRAGIVASNSEFRRLLKSGAIEVNQEIVFDNQYAPRENAVVRIGKKRFLKILPT